MPSIDVCKQIEDISKKEICKKQKNELKKMSADELVSTVSQYVELWRRSGEFCGDETIVDFYKKISSIACDVHVSHMLTKLERIDECIRVIDQMARYFLSIKKTLVPEPSVPEPSVPEPIKKALLEQDGFCCNLLESLKKSKKILSDVNSSKSSESSNPDISDDVLSSSAIKLYQSCKKKLASVKNKFTRMKVKHFFSKYFSKDHKNFSKKYTKKVKKADDRQQMLKYLRIEIKNECEELLGDNKLREFYIGKIPNIVGTVNLGSIHSSGYLIDLMKAQPSTVCKEIYNFFRKNPEIKKLQKDTKKTKAVIDLFQNEDNLKIGGKFREWSNIEKEILKAIK